MARGKKNDKQYFVITIGLDCTDLDIKILNKRFEIARHMYNKTLAHAIKRLSLLRKDKNYREFLSIYHDLKLKISKISCRPHGDSKTKEEKELKKLEKEFKYVKKELTDLQRTYGLSEFQLHEFIAVSKRNFERNIDINTAQAIASTVWKSISTNLFGNSKKCHFKKHGTLTSVEGKTNKSGIILRKKKITKTRLSKKDKQNPKKKQKLIKETVEKDCLVWNGLQIPVKYRKDDLFIQECIELYKPQYCRIVKKIVKGEDKFYLQLIIEGVAPSKRKNDGSFRNEINSKKTVGRVGIDIGTQTIATVSKNKCRLMEFAPKSNQFDREIFLTQRALDRSRRTTNPNNYNKDGTIKQGIKIPDGHVANGKARCSKLNWVRSKGYMKLIYKLKELYRLKSVYVEHSHNILANQILIEGSDIFVENMNYKALSKRAKFKEGEELNKKGKNKRKKRFGKSIGNKSPGKFLTVLNTKLQYQGKSLNKVNNYTFKASQYNHIDNEYKKENLNTRNKIIGKRKVQRDLYSAFLMYCSNDDLQTANQEMCIKEFDNFIKNHNIEIARLTGLKKDGTKFPSSMGIK